ncbi:MAG: histidine kinase [Alteromonadaceae bacterium]|nr:histidine kinase [Alteromonadaceae bacterium]
MRLKQQLLIVGALTFLIPLAGIQFVVQLEEALRAQELNRMTEQAQRIARLLPASHTDTVAAARTVFAETFTRQLILDGYGDDWPNNPEQDGVPLLYADGEHLQWRAAFKDEQLWLFLKITGLSPVFASSSAGTIGDRLILHWKESGSSRQERVIEARAPGRVRVSGPRGEALPASRIDGVWQTHPDGFTVELSMPRPPPGSQFGFNLQHPQHDGMLTVGTLGPEESPADPGKPPLALAQPELPRLVEDQPALQNILRSFAGPGQSLTLINAEGWQLAQATGAEPGTVADIDRFDPLELLQQVVLQGLRVLLSARQDEGQALTVEGSRWYGKPLEDARTETGSTTVLTRSAQGESMLTVITPVVADKPRQSIADGQPRYLVSRLSTDALLSLSSTALGQVLARSLLFMVALLLILVGYASWLSWRVARLRQAVNGVVDADGRVTAVMEPSHARDELGDLSRQFASLVAQIRSYTSYLESFARKLSHELKTPLAVMRSSLDNLKHCEPTPAQTVYLERASDGAERLSRILTAMSEATRLEKSLTRTTSERFDLAVVVEAVAQGYRSLDPRVDYLGPTQPCVVLGAADLLVQALDKLLENARDFTPPEGRIEIRLERGTSEHVLSVCNDGPPLPDAMAEHIFDSFVTLREPGGEGHLGQGLVIVRLVAAFHRAKVAARNRKGGVCFTLRLPAPDPTQSLAT